MSEKKSNADKAYIIAKKLMDEKCLICFYDNFYLFNGMIWEKISDDLAYSIFADIHRAEFGNISITMRREIKGTLRDITFNVYKDSIINTESNGDINLSTRILNLKDFSLRKYTMDDFKFDQLPFTFKKEKEKKPNAPRFKKFLLEIMGYDREVALEEVEEMRKTIGFIIEWMGYSLLNHNPYHKALIMVGDGRNGKSVLQSIWGKIIGESNLCYLDLSEINDPVCAIKARNKKVAFCPDINSGQQLDTGIIKAAVAGEMVSGKELYKQPIAFPFSAKIVIAANELPYLQKVSSATKERFHILPFDQTFIKEKQDPYLIKKLEEELEDIFHIALGGLKRLKKRGYFELPDCVKNTQKSFYFENDTVAMWIQEEGDIDTSKSTSVIYDRFKSFCRDWGKKALGRNKFFDRLKANGYDRVKKHGHYYFEKINL